MDLIDRQAAIDEANAWLLDCLKVQKQNRSCGLIRRLEDLPSAQPYNLDEWCYDCKEFDHQKNCCPRYNRVIRSMLEATKPKTGRWIPDGQKQKHGYEWMHCSVCGFSDIDVPSTHTNFCPNCGAKMEGEVDG